MTTSKWNAPDPFKGHNTDPSALVELIAQKMTAEQRVENGPWLHQMQAGLEEEQERFARTEHLINTSLTKISEAQAQAEQRRATLLVKMEQAVAELPYSRLSILLDYAKNGVRRVLKAIGIRQ